MADATDVDDAAVRDLVASWRDGELVDSASHDLRGGLPADVRSSADAVGLTAIAADPTVAPIAARLIGEVGLGHAAALVIVPATGDTLSTGGLVLTTGRSPADDPPAWLGLRVAAPRQATSRSTITSTTAVLWVHALAGLGVRLDALARDHARTREAFGRPIRTFQTVAHRLVDIRAAMHELASLARATDVDTAVADLRSALSRAWAMVDDVLQVHGGMGYAEEHEVARHWRDVRMLRLLVESAPEPSAAPTAPTRRAAMSPSPARADARAFVADELTPHVTAWERTGDWPREVFRTVAAAGGLGAMFDVSLGGTGRGMVDRAMWIEELSRAGSGGLVADLGASVDLAALYVLRAGSEAQRQRWLPGLLSGDLVGALGITEPGTGSDVAGVTTRAGRDADGWVIDGAKVFITNGPWADIVVTAAKVGPADGGGDSAHGQLTLFAVPGDAEGLARRRLSMLGWRASHTGELVYDGVRVDDDARLGEVGSGFGWIVRNFAWERLTLALGAIVSSEDALDEIPVRCRDGRWEDLDRTTRAARALVDRALVATADDPEAATTLELVALAKLQTQTLAVRTADLALTVAGLAGGHMDHSAQRRLRDARLGPIGGGTDAIMREIVRKLLP